MAIQLLIREDESRWDRYVKKSNTCTAYHYTGWKAVIERSFGHRAYYLFSEDMNKGINGILPLIHFNTYLFGNFMVSLPYLNYGGICAEGPGVANQLLDSAVSIAKREKAEFIEFRDTRPSNNELAVKTTKVSMERQLPSAPDQLWKSLSAKLRSQIRRPQKESMVVRIGREEELDSFYDVFSVNMRDLGTPVYSKSFFKNIFHEFPHSTWICSIYHRSVSVASAFLLGFKERMEIPWASSLKNYNRFSPNMLLYWSALKLACEEGYSVFDFGRSSPGEGTYRFKEQWGASPVQLYWHYWLKEGGIVPEINPKNKKYQRAIKLWRKLPVRMANLLGPLIVKNIP